MRADHKSWLPRKTPNQLQYKKIAGARNPVHIAYIQSRTETCSSSPVFISSYKTPTSSTMSERKAVVKNADMSEDMQQDAIDCANQGMEKFNLEKDIAAHIKKEFDKKYNPTWHCIVGRNFGSYVTHETKHFIYFYLGQIAILLFKSG
ncbi:dynein light chain 2, cytoplasmic-like [Diadema setosum]|uniref:dynein light chain 2, cytoplasmic-like n=1 Tax=Diadema setosum TaxID=31175 RepID=UPI003B3B5CCB